MIECPHCGGAIELVRAAPQPDWRQGELALGPIGIISAKKVIDAQQRNYHAGAIRFPVKKNSFLLPSPEAINESVNRIASCEEENLIESIRTIVGEKEFTLNAQLWRVYFRNSSKALRYAVEDWKLRTPDQQRQIKNKAAWLTDRYKRALAEICARPRQRYK